MLPAVDLNRPVFMLYPEKAKLIAEATKDRNAMLELGTMLKKEGILHKDFGWDDIMGKANKED